MWTRHFEISAGRLLVRFLVSVGAWGAKHSYSRAESAKRARPEHVSQIHRTWREVTVRAHGSLAQICRQSGPLGVIVRFGVTADFRCNSPCSRGHAVRQCCGEDAMSRRAAHHNPPKFSKHAFWKVCWCWRYLGQARATHSAGNLEPVLGARRGSNSAAQQCGPLGGSFHGAPLCTGCTSPLWFPPPSAGLLRY